MLEKLIEKIKEFKFKEAREYLEKRAHLIDPLEIDELKNTLMHICMHAMVSYFRQCSKKYTIELSDEKGEEVSRTAADFEELIDKMLKLNIPFNAKNMDGDLPIEILFKCDTQLDEKSHLEVACLKKFDEKGIFLHSGRKYVPELTLFKGDKKIPNKWKERNKKDNIKMTLHQRLALWRKYVEDKKSEHLPKGSFNLVIANIGFLLTDKRANDKKSLFITLPIIHKDFFILRSDKSKITSDTLFTSGEEYSNTSHAEYGLIQYLHDSNNIKTIVGSLKDELESDEYQKFKVEAVILDIYSQEECCLSCEGRLHSLQTNYLPNSFLRLLENELLAEENEFELPTKDADKLNRKTQPNSNKPKLPLILRVSSTFPTASPGKLKTINTGYYPELCNDYSRDIKRHDLNTMLHSLPVFDRRCAYWSQEKKYSQFFSQETDKIAKKIKEDRKNIMIQPENNKCAVRYQTIFISSGGNAKNITWQKAGIDLNKSIGTLATINPSDPPVYLTSALKH